MQNGLNSLEHEAPEACLLICPRGLEQRARSSDFLVCGGTSSHRSTGRVAHWGL